MLFETYTLQLVLIALSTYLIGALPTAYLIGRFRGVNVFEVGSGNMGGTNVARAMGLQWGLITVALDICKGIAAIWLAQRIMPDRPLGSSVFGGLMAVTGHNWSIIASLICAHYSGKFTLLGGKGAATATGTMIMLVPAQPLIAMVILGVILVILTRYVSLGVLAAFSVSLGWTLILSLQHMLDPIYAPYALLMAVLIVWRFRENIQRLLRGTERKLGERVAV